MKILHAPINIVNIPYNISREFRKMGYICDVMEWVDDDSRRFSNDKYVLLKNEKDRFRKFKFLSFAAKAVFKYDIFQFHQRKTLVPNWYDIHFIRKLRKKYFIYHHGIDVIGNTNYIKHVPYSKWAEAIFVSTPDLYDFVPRSAILIPQAINVKELRKYVPVPKYYRDSGKNSIIITHAISAYDAKKKKGTDDIVSAIQELKKRGLKIDFRLLIGEKHDITLSEIANADIHIDQMVYGWHGTISAEAMAMGTPIICYIRPDLEVFAQNLPVFRAEKYNLSTKIERLIQNVSLRKELSSKGVEYVRKVHDASRVASKLLEIYNL